MEREQFIILNGERFGREQITKKLTQPGLSEWETELFSFLTEWFSASDFVLAHSSGSTGEPKTIELPKAIMQRSAERTIEYFGLQQNDKLLLSLPCRYIAGKMMVVRAIVGHMNLITVDPSTNFDFLNEETYNFGAFVPNQVIKILEQPSGEQKLQRIRNLLIGGSAVSTQLEEQLSGLNSRIVSTYGMTETASHIAIRELSGKLKSEFYQCLSDISVSLQGNGCLQIHLPEFSEPMNTNDLAELASNKAFRILGRADSVIISGGIKYSPEAIEKKIEKLIAQNFVIASLPDNKLGEKIVLVIEGYPFETGSLQEKIEAILPAFERPKAILFLSKFSLTQSGKIKRAEIRDLIRIGC